MKYLVAVKLEEGSELFGFPTQKDRQEFINELDIMDIECITSEVEE